MLNRVQELREARSLTLEELAKRVDSSPRLLAALEQDGCVVTVDVALKLARALGSTVEELFDARCQVGVSDDAERSGNSENKLAETPVSNSVETEVVESVADGIGDENAQTTVSEATSQKSTRKSRQDREKARAAVETPGKRARRKKTDEPDAEHEPQNVPRVDAYAPRVTIDELSATEGEPLFWRPDCNVSGGSGSCKGRHVYAPTRSQTISSYDSKTAKTEGLAANPPELVDPTADGPIRFFDLFCGIGGFRYAANNVFASMRREGVCVLSCDVDPHAQQSYAANFGDVPYGDVEKLPSDKIPDFDLLFAGFPCQTFSIIGLRKGFADETKGSLFFQIARILRDKRPRAFVLENVRQLTTHDGGRTFEIILRVLQDELGYYVDWRVLNALDFGLPQKRERVVVVGSTAPFDMEWPKKTSRALSLADVLEPEREVPKKYYASPEIVKSRKKAHQSQFYPSVWHENKSGYVSSYPYSCALRAGASYNYLLVNGERRFTPLELLRLQGFPDDFKIVVSYTQLRKQVGNAAPVNLIERALERFLPLVFEVR